MNNDHFFNTFFRSHILGFFLNVIKIEYKILFIKFKVSKATNQHTKINAFQKSESFIVLQQFQSLQEQESNVSALVVFAHVSA